MSRNYRVESVEPRDRISHDDFFRPRKRVTLVCMDDGVVLQVLFPISRSPKRGDRIMLDDREVDAIRTDAMAESGVSPVLKN